MGRRITLWLALVVFGGSANALSVYISVQNELCGNMDGSLYANASGGVPPYTYVWSNAATTAGINGLGPGTYSVTVTDFVGTEVTENATIIAVDHTDQFSLTGDAYCPLGGMPYPFARWSPDGVLGDAGPPPYSFNGNVVPQDPYPDQELYNVPIESSPGVFAMPGESVQMQYMDGNGCGGTFWATAGFPVDWPTVTILQVEGACAGAPNGSVLVAYGAEGHGYSVDSEIRDALNNIVVQGGSNWYGMQPTTLQFDGLAAGDYWLYQRLTMAEASNYYTWCADVTTFTIPDLGAGCGNVNGTVYMDYNEDCVMGNSSETRVPGAVLEFTPGPYYATANSGGAYSVNLPAGAMNMQQIATGIAQHCPAPPAVVNVSGVQTINVGDTSLVPMDAQVLLNHGPARPGFELHYAIHVFNLTPASTGNTSTVFTFEPTLSLISATPTPTNIAGNVLTWDQGALGAFGQRSIQVRVQVPPDIGLIGTILYSSVSLWSANPDADLSNNIIGSPVTVTASFDPNAKVARTSTPWGNGHYYIGQDDWIEYTLLFQNTGTDTAFTVIVTDTLPATLDPATIQWGAASHACMRSLTGQGIVKFIFPNILLPDSNVNEPASHGFAAFNIRPRQPLIPGTEIENTANIFFDFNPPVITEPSVLVAEFSTGIEEQRSGLSLYPNPGSGIVRFSTAVEVMVALRILTTDGRAVLHGTAAGTSTELDVSRLATGIYIVEAATAEGRLLRATFCKQ